MLFDCSTKNVFIAADADGSVPLFWGTDAEGHLVLSDEVETVKKVCAKSFAPFPKGCFFTSYGGLRNFEYPLNELKHVPRVDSSGEVCGVTFKVDSADWTRWLCSADLRFHCSTLSHDILSLAILRFLWFY